MNAIAALDERTTIPASNFSQIQTGHDDRRTSYDLDRLMDQGQKLNYGSNQGH